MPDLRRRSLFDLLVWVFIAAGIVSRLSSLDVMEFKEDELTHMLNGVRAAADPWSAPLLAGEGTTLSPGVFFYKLLAVPISVTHDPVWVARFIASVNVVAIPALYLLLRRYFDPRLALWATALYATAPWMVVFSRKIWNPDLLVPFLLITLWCLCSAMERYALWKVVALAGSLALLSQLHLSVWLALFPPLLLIGLLLRPWRHPRDLTLGLGAFAAVYLVTLGSRTGEFIARFAGASGEQPDLGMDLSQLIAYNAGWTLRIPSGFGFGFLLGSQGYDSFAGNMVVSLTRPVFLVSLVLAGAGGVLALGRMVRGARASFDTMSQRFLLFLILMAVSLHVLYLSLRIAAHPHYHVILSLLPPLLAALFLTWLSGRFRTTGPMLARTLLVAVLTANVAFGWSFLAFLRAHPEAIDGDYGRPYFVEQERWERRLDEAIRRLQQE